MKTPVEWESWCDAVFTVRKSYPTWHELITAIQEDACGTNLSHNGIGVVAALLREPTSPDYGPAASLPESPSPAPNSEASSGCAIATAVKRRGSRQQRSSAKPSEAAAAFSTGNDGRTDTARTAES